MWKKINLIIGHFLSKVPGEKKFGRYRFLPFFFLLGAGLEFSMIHWKPNGVNFYTTYKRTQVDVEARRQIEFERRLKEHPELQNLLLKKSL